MLSVPMSLAYFGMTVVWLQYGLVTGKHIVVIPNSIGVVLQAITVSLFFIYPRRPMAVSSAPSKTENLTLWWKSEKCIKNDQIQILQPQNSQKRG